MNHRQGQRNKLRRGILLGLILATTTIIANEAQIRQPLAAELFLTPVISVDAVCSTCTTVLVSGKRLTKSADGHFRGDFTLEQEGANRLSFIFLQNNRYLVKELTVRRVATFPDIDGHWAQSQLEALATLGLLSGLNGTAFFAPDQVLNREDTALMLSQMLLYQPTQPVSACYSDLNDKYWATPYICQMTQAGYLSAFQQDIFAPRALLTRNEGVVLALRFLGATITTNNLPIARDLPPDFWANNYLQTAQNLGILPPSWDLRSGFYPLRPLRRAELAYMLAQQPAYQQLAQEITATRSQRPVASPPAIDRIRPPSSNRQHQAQIKLEHQLSAPRGADLLLEIVPSAFGLQSKVSRVMLDLSPLGRDIHAILLDDGLWADKLPFDQVFSLMLKIPSANHDQPVHLSVFFETEAGNYLAGTLYLTIR